MPTSTQNSSRSHKIIIVAICVVVCLGAGVALFDANLSSPQPLAQHSTVTINDHTGTGLQVNTAGSGSTINNNLGSGTQINHNAGTNDASDPVSDDSVTVNASNSEGSSTMFFRKNNNLSVGINNGVITIDGVVQGATDGKSVTNVPMVTNVRAVPSFQGMSIDVPASVVVVRGDVPSVSVEAPQNVQEHIIVRVEGGTLMLTTKGDFNVTGRQTLRIKVTSTQALSDATINGVGDVDLGVLYGDVRLHLNAVGNVVGHGDMNNLRIESSGTNGLTLTGSAQKVVIDNSGVGSLDVTGLTAQRVQIDASGVGATKVNATQSVVVDLSGVGSVTVTGNPAQRDVTKSGLGSVKFR